MADDTNTGWSMGDVMKVVGGAALGAAVLPVAAPLALGAVGLGAVASAIGVTSVSAGIGAILGGWWGHSQRAK